MVHLTVFACWFVWGLLVCLGWENGSGGKVEGMNCKCVGVLLGEKFDHPEHSQLHSDK